MLQLTELEKLNRCLTLLEDVVKSTQMLPAFMTELDTRLAFIEDQLESFLGAEIDAEVSEEDLDKTDNEIANYMDGIGEVANYQTELELPEVPEPKKPLAVQIVS